MDINKDKVIAAKPWFKPDERGYYGQFGGCFLPEGLIEPIHQLNECWKILQQDNDFWIYFNKLLSEYAGRPTALTPITRFSAALAKGRGPQIVLKREDLLHTGAHKLNNALGQCLLAERLGKTRIIAETGAGQHGVATATACAYLGLSCVVYMGAVDMERQSPNVARMRLLGAEVIPVTTGSQTLKDAVNEALRDWAESFVTSHYCLGSALGPHPYPEMVAAFQAVIGREAKQQCQALWGSDPDIVVACVGGGSNAIGIFSGFWSNPAVQLIGVEAGGRGPTLGEHAARFQGAQPGVLHGSYSYLLQDSQGQIAPTHSISAGLDYPSVGPQHAALFESKRAIYPVVEDQQVLAALELLAETTGIIPALESAHAVAYVLQQAAEWGQDKKVLINLSGRGDKDLPQILALKAAQTAEGQSYE